MVVSWVSRAQAEDFADVGLHQEGACTKAHCHVDSVVLGDIVGGV